MSEDRFVRDEGVAGSNPATPTTLSPNPAPLPDSFADRNRPVRINENERKVLRYLAEDGFSWDFGYAGFAAIMANTQLDRKVVRRACRSLARKGLTEYGRGLWNDMGEPAGSGYCATKQGVAFIEQESTP